MFRHLDKRSALIAAALYVVALFTIFYPAYGPRGYVAAGLGTSGEVLVGVIISLAVLAILFITTLLSHPVAALIAAALALLAAFSPLEGTGLPVVVGGAAAFFGWRAREERPRSKLPTAAFVVGTLAVLATVAIVVLEPLFD